MDFYTEIENALLSDDVDVKASITHRLLAYCSANEVRAEDSFVPKPLERPSFADRCRIVSPRELPARKDFDTPEGLATLVHAVAHIEYSAIDLALDAVYRFPQMPDAYRRDWLEVAADEIRHFGMLHEILETLGFAYGDLPVHQGLFDAAQHTAHSVLDRMAVIPRFYEATGLDVNPQIIRKLQTKQHYAPVKRVMEALDVIYEEEIIHVHKGDKWFKYLCAQEGLDEQETYFAILERYDLLKKHRPHINVNARKEAGFACEEILKLGAKQCE